MILAKRYHSLRKEAAIMVSETEVFGLLGRIHVLLRRELGRITDVDYMQRSADYSREILTLARSQGPDTELTRLATRLEPLLFGREGLFAAPDTRPLLEQWRDRRTAEKPAQATPDAADRYRFGPRG